MLMVPRPRKELQEMTMGRSGNPQNAKLGEYFWCLNKKLHFTTGVLGLVRKAATGSPSTEDAVPQLGLHLNSSM